MKRLIYLLFIASIPTFTLAQNAADSVITLDQCIALAIKNNVETNRAAIAAERAKVNYQQQRSKMLPDLNASLSFGINQGRSIDPTTNDYINQSNKYSGQSLNSSLLLFNGMALQNIIKQYGLAYQASVQDEQQAKDNLSITVTLAYLQVLTNEELLSLSRAQQLVTLQQAERLDILNKNGNVSPGEYYDLKGQYANDKLSLAGAINSLANSRIELATYLGIPVSSLPRLQPLSAQSFSTTYEATAADVYNQAIDKLAILKAASLRQQSAAMFVKASRGGFYPAVFFDAGLSSNYSGSESTGYFGQFKDNLYRSYRVGISIPLFNAFRTKNAVSLAKLSLRESSVVVENTRLQIGQITGQAYANMVAARDKYTALKEQVDAYGESFRTAEIRFNAGVINSVDYLVAKNNLERARLNFVATGYDFILRKKILDFYQGKVLGQ
ncbi:TolC family protein [Hufsiella ginkgonis]|uniref:TolC family protein n=1 Tax=Hufsiella ginkgonis TaxID=2695274 RepID=A0A7K1XV31_9SPHI|nr:TolC family protein [Hufsiella ginkgonis]MXV14865.1 TolC family protein [Hufsiella ginkgonis]